MTTHHIPLRWLKPPLTGNWRGTTRVNGHVVAKVLAEARWAIRAARLPAMVGANVTLVWQVTDKRRRDADNIAATLKPVLDALVQEGVLPDDSWVHVPETRQRIVAGDTFAMWLEVEDIS